MDYEQRYKEALERCRKVFNFSNLAYSHEEIRQRLEYIFPELKESGDDRIRKAILSALRGGIDTEKYLEKHGTNYAEVENWFEKQGEQNPTWSEEDEKMWSQVVNEIEAIKSNSSTIFEKNIAQDKIDWLKSLKDRMKQ